MSAVEIQLGGFGGQGVILAGMILGRDSRFTRAIMSP